MTEHERAAPRYVLESYQVAGEPLAPVRVMEVGSIGEGFDARENGVASARVRVTRLGPRGRVAARHPYRAVPGVPGLYRPQDSVLARPLATYRVRVEIPDVEDPLRARTTIPDTFRVLSAAPDTVGFRSGAHVPLPVTESRYPGRGSIYLLNTRAPEPTFERLTPAGRELVAGLESLAAYANARNEPYTVGSLSGNEWPLTRAASYPRPRPGVRTITYPWRAVLFYGTNRIDVHVVDDNLYDFIRTVSAQKKGAGRGTFTGVLDHVENGTGVFGGLARASHTIYVRRQPR